MKKSRISLLLLSSILLVGCGTDSSSQPSSTPTSETSADSSVPVSSSSETSSSSEDTEVTTFYNVFTSALESMSTQDSLQVKTVKDQDGVENSSLSIEGSFSTKNVYYLSTGELDTSQGDNGVETITDGLTINLTNLYYDFAGASLQDTSSDDFKVSLELSSDLSYVYSPSDNSGNVKDSLKDVAFSMFVNSGNLYLDMDNDNFLTLLSLLLQVFYGGETSDMSLLLKMLPDYWMISDYESYLTGMVPTLPTDFSFSYNEETEKTLETYSSYLSNVLDITTDSSGLYYADLSLNKSFMSILPLIYSAIAISQLDEESETYDDDLAEIEATRKAMSNFINAMTITTFDLSIVLDETGFKSIEKDIDFTVKNYTVSEETYDDVETSYVVDDLDYVQTGKTLFYYGDDVTVASPDSDHDYTDIISYFSNLMQ